MSIDYAAAERRTEMRRAAAAGKIGTPSILRSPLAAMRAVAAPRADGGAEPSSTRRQARAVA